MAEAGETGEAASGDVKLERTPTWIVASVCFVIILVSLIVERLLHHLGKVLKRKNQKPLFDALQKVKEELMLLGFISLLLTVLQGVIQKICIPEQWNHHMLPCKMEDSSDSHGTSHFQTVFSAGVFGGRRRLLSGDESGSDHCSRKNHAVLLKMGKYTGITAMCAIPTDSSSYIPINKRPPVTDQVVIGTPGTIKKWTTAKKLSTRDVKILVFDEADHMLAEKFHWRYRERMRKLDILNYQKMYAIGFLQPTDDPLQSVGSRRTLGLAFQSIFAQSSWSVRRKSNVNPSEKLIKELQTDLEVVYVGQTCLSWEFLRWQYEKAREMPQLSDPFGNHFYNQAAREFQQFQVNIQRFIENEAFQGPRLRNFIQNRCVLHNLLQVPVLKEDCSKDKMLGDGQGMSGEKMEEIMEESIRIFWEFVKADKDETPGILRGFMGTHVELQDPSDFDLVEDIQFDLHKKEKKLKDILRTGNCLVKKFKKPKEDRSNEDVFFSQVDLKLVGRILRMPVVSQETEQNQVCRKEGL